MQRTLTPEDLSEIKTISKTLSPHLEALEKLVRAFERDENNKETIGQLNMFSNEETRYRNQAAPFSRAMLGLIGAMGSHLDTLVVFDVDNTETMKKIKNATKISTLKISIPLALPDLIQFTEKFQSCSLDDASKKLCADVIDELKKLSASVEGIRKKFNFYDDLASDSSYKPST